MSRKKSGHRDIETLKRNIIACLITGCCLWGYCAQPPRSMSHGTQASPPSSRCMGARAGGLELVWWIHWEGVLLGVLQQWIARHAARQMRHGPRYEKKATKDRGPRAQQHPPCNVPILIGFAGVLSSPAAAVSKGYCGQLIRFSGICHQGDPPFLAPASRPVALYN